MLDGEQPNRRDGAKIGVGDDRMGRAEVNADQIAGRAGSSDNLVLPVLLVSEKNFHQQTALCLVSAQPPLRPDLRTEVA